MGTIPFYVLFLQQHTVLFSPRTNDISPLLIYINIPNKNKITTDYTKVTFTR